MRASPLLGPRRLLRIVRRLAAGAVLAATTAQATGGGAVASAGPLASRAGEDVVRDEGNAADAAVATALALAVTFPQAVRPAPTPGVRG